jgi:hypothetical protein
MLTRAAARAKAIASELEDLRAGLPSGFWSSPEGARALNEAKTAIGGFLGRLSAQRREVPTLRAALDRLPGEPIGLDHGPGLAAQVMVGNLFVIAGEAQAWAAAWRERNRNVLFTLSDVWERVSAAPGAIVREIAGLLEDVASALGEVLRRTAGGALSGLGWLLPVAGVVVLLWFAAPSIAQARVAIAPAVAARARRALEPRAA